MIDPMPARLVPTAEAAFIAGLTDRQMNRVVDERLVPDALFEQQGNVRRFTRLCAAFAKFYFDTENVLVAAARRQVLEELTRRVEQLSASNDVLALVALPRTLSWKVARFAVEVDVTPYVQGAFARAREVDRAGALVTADPEIMSGVPVFAGTRVPIEIVLGSLARDIDMGRLKASFPFLTEAHVHAARVHEAIHPRRGRPRRMAEANPDLTRRVTRVVRRAPAA
jgi:uncharacterized protein (DUF433 family)